jgi:type II secretory pathway component PulF
MPLFEYKAVAPSGETVQGTMEAASLDLVILKLQEAGNIPLQARESGTGGFSLGGFSLGRRGMNTREVGEFTQQLSTLLGAGLPLDRSLQVTWPRTIGSNAPCLKSGTRCAGAAASRMRSRSSMERSTGCS